MVAFSGFVFSDLACSIVVGLLLGLVVLVLRAGCGCLFSVCLP